MSFDNRRGSKKRLERPLPRGPRHMGSVARKGAARVQEDLVEQSESKSTDSSRDDFGSFESAEDLSAQEVAQARLRAERREARQARTKQLRAEAHEAVQRGSLTGKPQDTSGGRQRGRKRSVLVRNDGLQGQSQGESKSKRLRQSQSLAEAVGVRDEARYRRYLNRAEAAYAAEDFHKAWRSLEYMVKDVPNVAEVRELAGLVLYRLGRWSLAASELEALRELTGRVDYHPILADCYRAQRRWADVDAIWLELQDFEERAAPLAEGRIVVAGALGDRGEYQQAVQLLAEGFQRPRRAKEHHLRQAYVLADLYEQAGEIPRARELFMWLQSQDEHYVDVIERLDALC